MYDSDVVQIFGRPAAALLDASETGRAGTISETRYGRGVTTSYWRVALASVEGASGTTSNDAGVFGVAITHHGVTSGPRFTVEMRAGDLDRAPDGRPRLRGRLVACEDFDLRGRGYRRDGECAAMRRVVGPILEAWRAVWCPAREPEDRTRERSHLWVGDWSEELWIDGRSGRDPRLLLVGQRFDPYEPRVARLEPNREGAIRPGGWWSVTIWRYERGDRRVADPPLVVRRTAERPDEPVSAEAIRGAIALAATSGEPPGRDGTCVPWSRARRDWLRHGAGSRPAT